MKRISEGLRRRGIGRIWVRMVGTSFSELYIIVI